MSEIWSRISDEETYNLTYYNPRFSPTPDAGTSHLSILVPNGDAVSVTTLVSMHNNASMHKPIMLFSPQCSTVNFFYGAKIITDTGIVLNNQMDDFSSPGISSGPLPPSNINFVRPGKRPLSSTCPSIAVMVITAALAILSRAYQLPKGGEDMQLRICLVVTKHSPPLKGGLYVL